MKILYDDQCFNIQQFGGISRYFSEMMHFFDDSGLLTYDLTTRFTRNGHARRYNLTERSLPHRLMASIYSRLETMERYSPWVVARKQKLNLECREKLFRRGKYDVFHPTYYNPYFLDMIGAKPFVVTAYDMIHELFPEMYQPEDPTRIWKKMLFARAARIIAISESTKRDLVKIAGVPAEKIDVVHLACSIYPANASASLPLPDRYLLFVGERIRYKNFETFIRSVATLMQADNSLAVVCAGGGPLLDSEKELFTELSITGQVLQYTVDDSTLAALYSRALMFVFPSHYEGFGLPVLEAFSCGCPVVLSSAGSFPEVAEDAALYFDPADEGSLRHAIEKVLNDGELRSALSSAGIKRAAHFSWEKTARETMTVYKSVI